jgi:hypothetical protein
MSDAVNAVVIAAAAVEPGELGTAMKRVRLVAFPNVHQEQGADCVALRKLSEFSRAELREEFLKALDRTFYTRTSPLLMEFLGTFLEYHADGSIGGSKAP